MASRIKYSREQRKRAHDLFWTDRAKDDPRAGGRYTAKQISEMTGVSVKYVYMIAHGER